MFLRLLGHLHEYKAHTGLPTGIKAKVVASLMF